MLIDKVKVYVKAGDGGNGAVTFRREKYVSHGGPDGGDGGRGGNIIITIDEGTNTLLDYKNRRKFIAQNGENGSGAKFHGGNGKDTVLPVPPGTVIKDAESGLVIKDMSEDGEPFVLCRGGKGGWGNRHFATPTRRTPRFAKSGLKGEEREVIFELKMIADVGLIGFPSVGKSSILSVISAARPKIAEYHFTTLSPNLGVVRLRDGRGFVAADIPGLIEGASEGAGLGHAFLRHIERCRMLLHVVDVSGMTGRDPVEDIITINRELERFSEALASLPQLLIANKCDAISDPVALARVEKYASEHGLELIKISAATRQGIDGMLSTVADRLRTLPPVVVYEPEYVCRPESELIDRDNHEVEIHREGSTYVVEADWLWNLVGSVNFEDRDSLRYFQRVLRTSGVIDRLEEAGCGDGDSVAIYDFEFDFVK